jgi:hypothetical protein
VDFGLKLRRSAENRSAEKVAKAAAIAKKRGSLAIKTFKTKRIEEWVPQLRAAYNGSFEQNRDIIAHRNEKWILWFECLNSGHSGMLKMIARITRCRSCAAFPDVSRAFPENKGKLVRYNPPSSG